MSEMVLPQAVHHDAGRERIVRSREPPGQSQPSAPGFLPGQRGVAEHLDETPGHLHAGLVRLPANLHAGIVRRAFRDAIGQRHGTTGQPGIQLAALVLLLRVRCSDLRTQLFESGLSREVSGRRGLRRLQRRQGRLRDYEVVSIECRFRSWKMPAAVDVKVVYGAIPAGSEGA